MKQVATALLALAAGILFGADAKEYGEYNGVMYAKNGAIELGEWTSQYEAARALAEKRGIPMLLFWGNKGCTHCNSSERNIAGSEEFAEWQKSNGIVMVYLINNHPGDAAMDAAAKKAKKAIGSANYPIIVYYWPKKGESWPKFDSKSIRTETTQSAKQIMSQAATRFAGYIPQFDVMGAFDVDAETETEFNRLEAEAAGPVAIRLTRENGGEAVDGTLEVSIAKANGLTDIPVSWAKSDKKQQQFVEVTIPDGLSAGDEITLTLKNEADEAENSAVIRYVAKAAKPTPTNPLWFGERNETTLGYGEWTMDLDVAMKKVKNDGGYTIALVQGSQWCGDCYNVEQKFLSQTNALGANAFCDWAESNKVALAVIDVPSFTNNTVDSAYSSLLKRDAAEKALGGVTALRSGLAYLTRKGADREGGTAAADILERNRKLVQTNTGASAYDDKRGFHRPEDGNAYRIGVPTFVLIRKDGTVAARLSRWAASTKADELDEAKTADYLKRFDEMLVLDKKATEIENNYASSGSIPLDANGAKIEEASLCAADTRDVFHLTGFGGGALEKITVSGLSDSVGKVNVAFVTLDADGKEQVVGTAKTANLSTAGFTLEHTFEPGDYYVRVSAADVTSKGDFAIGSTNANHFQWYSVKGEQILIPSEQKVTTAASASNELIVRLTSNEVYRLENMLSCDPAGALVSLAEAGANFYTAATSGDVKIKVDSTCQLVHQLWTSNAVGFVETSSTVSESVCDTDGVPLKLAVKRTGGVSGELKVKVSVNEDLTTLTNSPALKRFELLTKDLTWPDGVGTNQFVEVLIIDYDNAYYGEGDIVLDLEAVNPPYGCGVTGGKARYTLSVVEDDTAQPGKAMFSRVEPYAAKAKTIYVPEGSTGTVYAVRFEHSDGLASVILKSSVAGVSFGTENPRDMEIDPADGALHFYWSNHETTEKPIYVRGVPAGKTAKITMTAFNKKGTPSKSQFKVHSASNSVSVVGVAAGCPEFAVDRKSYGLDDGLCRYVYFTNAIPLKAGTYTNSAEYANKQYQKTFTKLSGALPSGLKAVWDKANDNLAIFGILTAKAGTYTAVYQVSEKRPSGGSAKNVAGLTVEIVFTVVDPVDAKQPGGALNPAAATSRTIPDLAVFGKDEKGETRLAGMLKLTIPPTGKLSAKYVCTTGTVSLSAKSWEERGFDKETRALSCVLTGTSKYKDYELRVKVYADYSVKGELHDPNFLSGDLGFFSDGKVWTKGSTSKTKPVPANTAEDWKGYYTVALVPEMETIIEEREDVVVAPRGTGYLTLKMDSASAWNAGKVTWAGMLPNGTTLSGSSVLTRGVDGLIGEDGFAYLPIFKQSKTDIVGLVVEIAALAQDAGNRRCVNDGIAVPYWKHIEKTAAAKASYAMDLDVCGAFYDKNESLNICCMADGGVLHVDVEALGGWTYAGTPTNEITDVEVEVVTGTSPARDMLKVSTGKAANPQSIALKFTRSTGIVEGSFKLPYTTVDTRGVIKEKTQSVKYRGVVLSGWDSCGECGDPQDGDVFLPFVNGAYYLSDKVEYKSGVDRRGNDVFKTLSVKRGGGVTAGAIDED